MNSSFYDKHPLGFIWFYLVTSARLASCLRVNLQNAQKLNAHVAIVCTV